MYTDQNVLFALGITLLAGMATGIGSLLAFFVKRTNYRFLSVAMGFSAGVMLYVSFIEIFPKSLEALSDVYGDYWGNWATAASFFGGILLIGLIDNLIPSAENPHETHSVEESALLYTEPAGLEKTGMAGGGKAGQRIDRGKATKGNEDQSLLRMGLFTALAIAIHNFPEGLATFLVALEDPTLGVAIGIAIALHNIPEGISVSVPIYYATGDRKKALLYSVLSGLAEPLGAGAAYLILMVLLGGGAVPGELMGVMFGGVAGIMVYISLDSLLPTSRAYGKGHDSLFGLVAGMLVMAVSLLLI
jgi:ZIP family zinc transporter